MSDSDAWVSAVISCSFEHSVGGIGLWVPKTISNHFSLFAEKKTLQLQGNCPLRRRNESQINSQVLNFRAVTIYHFQRIVPVG